MVETVTHTLQPWADEGSQVLILGTMPSPKSREKDMYYGHPQNRFWRTLARLFDEAVPEDRDACQSFALAHHIALWDVLAKCDINGAADASIRHPIANDVASLLAQAPIHTIFTTGKKANDLYNKLLLPITHIEAIPLPSTSAANRARWPDEALVDAYQVIRTRLEEGPIHESF